MQIRYHLQELPRQERPRRRRSRRRSSHRSPVSPVTTRSSVVRTSVPMKTGWTASSASNGSGVRPRAPSPGREASTRLSRFIPVPLRREHPRVQVLPQVLVGAGFDAIVEPRRWLMNSVEPGRGARVRPVQLAPASGSRAAVGSSRMRPAPHRSTRHASRCHSPPDTSTPPPAPCRGACRTPGIRTKSSPRPAREDGLHRGIVKTAGSGLPASLRRIRSRKAPPVRAA